MLVACRLAGLSALETYYAGVRARGQCGRRVMNRLGLVDCSLSDALAPALMVKFEGRKRPARRGRIGRVEDCRAGLGRSLYSLLARSFVCECHTISAAPRFQPPPRRTQHADFPHCALLFASPQDPAGAAFGAGRTTR